MMRRRRRMTLEMMFNRLSAIRRSPTSASSSARRKFAAQFASPVSPGTLLYAAVAQSPFGVRAAGGHRGRASRGYAAFVGGQRCSGFSSEGGT